MRQTCGAALALLIVLAILAAGCQQSAPPAVSRRLPTIYPTLAAPDAPCRLVDWMPYFNTHITCAEVVYDHVTPPEAAPALMGLAFAPDGTLYFARTAFGEIWGMRDADGDQFMDAPFLAAEGLALPTGIAFHDGALYVASQAGVLRLDDATGDGRFETQTVLVDDLPLDSGLWPGSVGIGPDGRLYVSLGAACETCTDADPRRGALLSYTLDGGDERIEARGLRSAADFAWDAAGRLWLVDSARPVPGPGVSSPPDELNRILPGADYGFPACTGDRVPDPAVDAAADCAGTEPPALALPHQSTPTGIAFYPADAFPFWQNDLIVALHGSSSRIEPAGYALAVVALDERGPYESLGYVAPASIYPPPVDTIAEYSLTGRGFYPDHPVDVAISPEGWIYVSLEEGRIYRYRPRPARHIPQAPTPTAQP